MIRRGLWCLSFIALSAMLWPLCALAASDVADAAQKGDVVELNKLLGQHADVNQPQADGSTALHWAVYRDDLGMVDALINAGALVNVATREGITPLYMASSEGNRTIIEKLLKSGADAKALGPNGETHVMLAARNGNPEAVQSLITAGADVNASEPLRGTTALMWAVARKNSGAVAALLHAGADPGARSAAAPLPRVPRLSPPVNVANVRRAQQQLIAGLADAAKGVNASRRDAPAETAVGPGTQDDDAGALSGRAARDEGGMLTALVFAAREGDLESAKLLLAANADPNQTTNYGWSPLLTATNNRNYRLATFLIEHGANVNTANNGGWTPLYLATDNRNIESGDYPWPKPDMDHLEFIHFLLQHGADPNAGAESATWNRTVFNDQWFQEPGATPFVRAAQSSDVVLMKLLLAYGADPGIATNFGDTALSAAAGIGWVEGVTYEWSHADNYKAIQLLLDLGLDPNVVNRDGRTPLMGAAHKGTSDVVRLLVDVGARLETRDYGSRDTDKAGSVLAGHTWQAIDYSEGLVRVGVQSATVHAETAGLIRKLMTDRGLPTPDPNRTLESICIVVLCKGEPLRD